MKKIKSLDELSTIIQELKSQGKKIVHCHGVFDLLHPGHIIHFREAKKKGDVLIVTITKDEYVDRGPGKPVFSEQIRAQTIAAIDCVDYVAINKWPTALETIHKLKPDIYVKGSEFADLKDHTKRIGKEAEAVKEIGGKIDFTEGEVFSSSELLNNYFNVFPAETGEFLRNFKEKYSYEKVIGKLNELRDLKVMVIGDTILDQYHYCTVMDKSSKELLIPVKYIKKETFAGGVLAVANHLASFCNTVHLVSCLGKKRGEGDFILGHLSPNIQSKFFYREDAPTIIKRRFVELDSLTKMFEVCFIDDKPIHEKLEKEIIDYLKEKIEDSDIIIAADYGHGLITPKIIDLLCNSSKFLAVNTQINSANKGFNTLKKYKRADYICVGEPEVRLAVRNRFGDIKGLIKNLCSDGKYKSIIVTRGLHGSINYSREQGFSETPAFSQKTIDKIGAGDAFFSVTSLCAARSYPLELIGFVGNAVGALAVNIVCNRDPVKPPALYKFITTLLKWS